MHQNKHIDILVFSFENYFLLIKYFNDSSFQCKIISLLVIKMSILYQIFNNKKKREIKKNIMF